MTIPDPPSPKSNLRRAMRLHLRNHRPPSAGACAALLHWLDAHPQVRTVAAYSPLPGEVDLFPVIHQRTDLHWVFPKISGDLLTFHRPLDWATGPFGIREPTTASPETPVGEIDVFLCPGLAFDGHGGRLGRGRGFYDRILARARPGARKLGVCFPFQLVPETFSEPHDIHMDEVLAA